MVVVEILLGLLFAAVIVTAIIKVAAPMAEAYSVKLKMKYEEVGPEDTRQLKARMAAAEQEIRELKQQLASVQAASDFHGKILQSGISSANPTLIVSENAPNPLAKEPPHNS